MAAEISMVGVGVVAEPAFKAEDEAEEPAPLPASRRVAAPALAPLAAFRSVEGDAATPEAGVDRVTTAPVAATALLPEADPAAAAAPVEAV